MSENAVSSAANGVFLWLLFSILPLQATAGSSHFQPFASRDQNLFTLIHGQALPVDAGLLEQTQSLWSSSLIITNTLNIETSNGESINLDYESYRFNLSYQYGVNELWNFRIDVPLMHHGGGFLDSAIDGWHDFFGLPQGDRPFVENDQFAVHYQDSNQAAITLDEGGTALGDIQLAAARRLIQQNDLQLSLWGGLKLPTGDHDKLTGSGAADVSLWLAYNQRLTADWLVNINSGVVIPGQDEYRGIALSEQVIYGHIMLGWLVTDVLNLKLQLQGHSSYYENSQLEILGDSYFLMFGFSVNISRCQQFDIAFSEDIKVEASPDASLLLNWRSYPGC